LANHLHIGDLPDGLNLGPSVAIDCETMGLNPHRDRLCVVQLSGGDGNAHLVQIAPGQSRAPNLERLLADQEILKIFHFGRFDIAALLNASASAPPPSTAPRSPRSSAAPIPTGMGSSTFSTRCWGSTSRSSSR
jgi:ribonuclease D